MRDTVSIGRNDPCPCGSGRKFKKCHLRPGTDSTQAYAQLLNDRADQMQRRADARYRRYGKVRETISAEAAGHRIVAVGDEVHWAQDWRTFPDFLNYYVKVVLGVDWGNAQLRLPESDRHPILLLRARALEYQKRLMPDEDGIIRAKPSGPVLAWLTLAYDLYTLRHHDNLQKRLVDRLRHPQHFQGARYELFVAATFLRAGFDIEFEDERDPSTKHPEFIARHRDTGEEVAVEAKSRHHRGVLGYSGVATVTPETRAEVRGLLENAFAKPSSRPYVICVDVNLPGAPPDALQAPWLREIVDELTQRDSAFPDELHPYSQILVTNHPFHYSPDDEPSPRPAAATILSQRPRHPFRDPNLAVAIQRAAEQFGGIPNTFDE